MRLLERCAGEAMFCARLCTTLETEMRGAGRPERAVLYGAEGDRWVQRATAYHQAVAVGRGDVGVTHVGTPALQEVAA